MNVDVMLDGHGWKVALEPAGRRGLFTVTIKGRTRLIDASWIDNDTVSVIDKGAVREIRLHMRGDKGAVGVELEGQLHEAVVRADGGLPSTRGQNAKSDVTREAEAFRVKAPMPGRVVRVLVAVGDRVTARQPVVVVEAMKMENELRTPGDGVVREVLAVPGAAVESGAILVVLVR